MLPEGSDSLNTYFVARKTNQRNTDFGERISFAV